MGKRKKRPHDRSTYAVSLRRWRTPAIIVALVGGVFLVLALNFIGRGGRPPQDDAPPLAHDHPPGPHGGVVVVIDNDNRYHAEAVAGPRGVLRVYTYGEELSVPHPVPARVVCAAVRAHGGGEEFPLMLRPEPLAADPPGTTSRFVSRLPNGRPGGDAELLVRSLAVGADRFQFVIPLSPTVSDAESERAEAALYADPGGLYTAKDVAANGRRPASQKFAGERPRHDDRPAAGERVCPVSRARADDRFIWVVSGKEYRFCCPPCIDEFLVTAKERPDEIRDPDSYRHP